MGTTLANRTSPTLLGMLTHCPIDQLAWSEFVGRYAPWILNWCRRWGLQQADAEDVTQDVLVRLAKKMRAFEYDPNKRFRNWLRTVARHAWTDFIRERSQGERAVGGHAQDWLQTIAAREDLADRLERQFDHELLELAMARVRLRVEPATWEAFRLIALQGRPGAEVALKLGLRVATAFVARSRVQRLIREELQRLEDHEVQHDGVAHDRLPDCPAVDAAAE